MSVLPSYTKILTFGHAYVRDILEGEVVIQEKVDGSQISFGLDLTGELHIRSKGAGLITDAPEKMFQAGVAAIKAIAGKLPLGWVFRGEYLAKPKHNTLAYDRVPKNHIVLWDIEINPGEWASPARVQEWADSLGFEAVPTYFQGTAFPGPGLITKFDELLKTKSFLGGAANIEGIVIKNYARIMPDGKLAAAKIVSAEFKEVHGVEWKKNNPTKSDVVERLIAKYGTAPRFVKGVQHLAEAGHVSHSPKDIGPLIKEVANDISAECAAEIAAELYEHFWPQIQRGITNKIPQWYKERLFERMDEEARGPDGMITVLVPMTASILVDAQGSDVTAEILAQAKGEAL